MSKSSCGVKIVSGDSDSGAVEWDDFLITVSVVFIAGERNKTASGSGCSNIGRVEIWDHVPAAPAVSFAIFILEVVDTNARATAAG